MFINKIKNFHKIILSDSSQILRHFSYDLKDYKIHRDHTINGFFKDGSARFVFSDISNILSETRRRFNIYEFHKLQYLGIAYNTTILMNTFLAGEERVKLIAQFTDSEVEDRLNITNVYSESICTGEVRGYLEDYTVNKSDFEESFNQFLKVSKILYNHKSEVTGTIKLTENKLTENDIFRYFEESEQIRTYVKFKSSYKEEEDKMLSHGFILQKMPDCDLELLENQLKKIVESEKYRNMINDHLSITKIRDLFEFLNLDVVISGRTPVDFFCQCSLEDFKTLLRTFPREDLKDMKAKNQNSLKCRTCNTNYVLSEKDFEDILNNKST